VNDLPVAGQSRGVTEPQRERGTAAFAAVDEVFSLQRDKETVTP